MKTSVSTLSCALPVLLLIAAAPAFGQQGARPERPYRGLFASGTASEQQLFFNGSIGAGYDDNILADALQRTGRGASDLSDYQGTFRNASAGLSYSLNRSRFAVQVSGQGGVRYYPSLTGEQMVRSDSAQIDTVWRPRGGTTLSVAGGTALRPGNLNDLFPAELRAGPDSQDLDLPTTFDYYRRYGAGADLTQRLTSRVSFNANYAQRRGVAPGHPTFARQHAGGGLNFRLARGLSLRTGYAYHEAWSPDGNRRPTEYHTIDAGIDYNRSLSFSRQTTVSISTGSSAVKRDERDLRYRAHAIGRAALSHEIGRTWSASVAYFRGIRLVETWDEPLFSDVVTTGLAGLINRRIQLSTGAGGSVRHLGDQTRRRGFAAYWGTANMSIGLSRHLNLSMNYLYTRHTFDQEVPRPWAWLRQGERQRVSVHLGVWMPLVGETRRRDVTR